MENIIKNTIELVEETKEYLDSYQSNLEEMEKLNEESLELIRELKNRREVE